MTGNTLRIGNPTSSEIVRLLGNGERKMTEAELAARPKTGTGSKTTMIEDATIFDSTALEYIAECNMERRLKRSVDSEITSRPTSWGKLCEIYVYETPGIISLDYQVNLDKTTAHPDYPFWAGSEDFLKEDTVSDLKCPNSLKSFCQLVDPYYVGGLTGMDYINAICSGWEHNGVKYKKHPDGEKYKWQLISNACIHGKAKGELIIFCPYESELLQIQQIAARETCYRWIENASANELPYLKEDSIYKNVTAIEFEIPQADKLFLTEKVKAAYNLLV